MEAVYTLLDVERAVPEVFASTYDVRKLLAALSALRDGASLDVPVPRALGSAVRRAIDKTVVGKLLRESGLID
jgi:oleate hydratase